MYVVILLCDVHETGSESMRLHANVGRYTPTANSVNNIIHIFIVIKYFDVIIDTLLLIYNNYRKYKYNYNVLTVLLSV